jgi:hypothetical protein
VPQLRPQSCQLEQLKWHLKRSASSIFKGSFGFLFY